MGKQASDWKKKMAAPVVITVLFFMLLLFYGVGIATAALSVPMLWFLALPLIALGVGMIYTLKTRIKEIRSGEEDDLDNY